MASPKDNEAADTSAPSLAVQDTADKSDQESLASSAASSVEPHPADTDYWTETNWCNFCGSTTMHGWYFLVDESLAQSQLLSHMIRCCWAAVIAAMTAFGFYLIALIIIDYRDAKTTTDYNLQSVTSSNTFFPAVTVCNLNVARFSALRSVSGQDFITDMNSPNIQMLLDFVYGGMPDSADDKVPEFVSKVLKGSEYADDDWVNPEYKKSGVKTWMYYKHGGDLEEAINQNIDETMYPDSLDFFRLFASQDLSQSRFLRASYDGHDMDLKEFGLLYPFFDTEAGFCSYIRPQVFFDPTITRNQSYERLLDHNINKVKPGIPVGKKRGLYLLLDMEVFDYGHSNDYSDGVSIGLQHPLDFPVAKMATVDIRPGTMTTISIDPKVMTTEDFVVEHFSQESRACFAQTELKFDTLPNSAFRYSYDNCIAEGVFMQVLQECGCRRAMGSLMSHLEDGEGQRSQSGKGHNFSNFSSGNSESDEWDLAQSMRSVEGTLDGCYGKKLSCYLGKWRNFGKIRTIRDADQLKRNCRAACNGVNYAVHGVSTAAFPSYGALARNKYLYCLVYRKLLDICMTSSFNTTWWETIRIAHLEEFFHFHFHSSEYYQKKHREFWSGKVPHTNETYRDSSGTLATVCRLLIGQSRRSGTCLNDAQKNPMLVEELKSGLAKGLSDGYKEVLRRGLMNKHEEFVIPDDPGLAELLFNYSRHNLAAVHVVMGQLEERQCLRKEARPLIWILADIGGVMGLTTGCSCITFVEIAFFTWKYVMYVRYRFEQRAG